MEHNSQTPGGGSGEKLQSGEPPRAERAPVRIDTDEAQAAWEQGPEAAKLGRMLTDFESHVDLLGWDQSARLYTVHQVSDDEIHLRHMLAAHGGISITDVIDGAVEALHLPDISEAMTLLHESGYTGTVLVYEGWGMSSLFAAMADPNRPLADQPGSLELRVLQLRTVQGGELTLQRVRGYAPSFLPGRAAGRTIESMRSFMSAIDEVLGNRDRDG